MPNSKFSLKKSDFQVIMNLARNNNWLVNKIEELSDLIYEDCSSDEQRYLVVKLFERFNYFYREEIDKYVSELAKKITEIPNLTPDNTIITAMSQDSSPDSSQALINSMKIHFRKSGWEKVTLLNNLGNVYRKSKESKFKKNNIVVVDEFIGSGNTAVVKRDFLERTFRDNNKAVSVFVRVIFCSAVGALKLQQEAVDFDLIKKINRGITDYETAEEASSSIELMHEIEKGFSEEAGNHKMSECTLGYGGTESLFAVEGSFNIPNSVFPFLWWPFRENGTERNTLFTRYTE